MMTSEHMGTHIDAPAHLYKGKKRLDEVPLERLIGPCVVVDVRKQVRQENSWPLKMHIYIVRWLVDRSVGWSVSRTLVGQSVGRSVSQPVSHSVTQENLFTSI